MYYTKAVLQKHARSDILVATLCSSVTVIDFVYFQNTAKLRLTFGMTGMSSR